MNPKSGRLLRIARGGTDVAGARTDNLTINNEPIDITDKDDAGWRTLLADAGVRSVSADVEGVIKDDSLAADVVGASNAYLQECTITSEFFILTGDFYLQNLSLGAEMEGAVTFTATLESAEVVVSNIAPHNTVLPSITVNGGADSGDLTGANGTWVGDATITLTREWQTNQISADQNDTNWLNRPSEVAAETRHAAGDFVRLKVTATNSVGSAVAYSNVVT